VYTVLWCALLFTLSAGVVRLRVLCVCTLNESTFDNADESFLSSGSDVHTGSESIKYKC
jgi:hypothetical protein